MQRRPGRPRWRHAPVVLAAVVVLPAAAAGQTLLLKREIGPHGSVCAPDGSPTASSRSTAAQRQEASRLASAATQAAILGDLETARSQLERAVTLNPRSAALAYQFAGVLEQIGESVTAAEEYCRYLALNPTAPDQEDVRDRLRQLGGAPATALPDEAVTAFRDGVDLFDAGELAAAVSAFDVALAADPEWADARYNHGLAQLSRGNLEEGVRDLEGYLALAPGADDETTVAVSVVNIRNRMSRYTPGFAFMASQAFPGMGQFYLGRPGAGFLFALAGVGPVVFGFFYDTDTQKRPYFWETVAAGVGVGFVAGLEALFSARGKNRDIADLVRIPTGPGTLDLAGPGLVPSEAGVSLALIRLRF